ncbi:MAG: DUF3164 family protein [Pseudomonadota bacterium]
MTSAPQIPADYLQDAKGRLVPADMVSEIDRARDDLVREIAVKAEQLSELIATFKSGAMADIQAFIELSGEKYGVRMGGIKGNVTLLSYDGRYKLQRQISDYITFDERLQVAKKLIDECIHAWSDGSRPEILALVNDAFQVDKAGKVNTGRILGLRRLDIQDERWRQAMQAISDSIQVADTKPYLRIYKRRGASEFYDPISLDIAAL